MSSEKNSASKLEKQKDCKVSSLLDLPEWILDCILECLSPLDLCRVAQVCTYLRDRSRSDALWERQIKQKWGRLLGDVALQEWQWHTTKIINIQSLLLQHNQSGSCGSFSGVWPFLSFNSYLENFIELISLFKNCSKMALYISLESGRFWFPVQVYKVTLINIYVNFIPCFNRWLYYILYDFGCRLQIYSVMMPLSAMTLEQTPSKQGIYSSLLENIILWI